MSVYLLCSLSVTSSCMSVYLLCNLSVTSSCKDYTKNVHSSDRFDIWACPTSQILGGVTL